MYTHTHQTFRCFKNWWSQLQLHLCLAKPTLFLYVNDLLQGLFWGSERETFNYVLKNVTYGLFLRPVKGLCDRSSQSPMHFCLQEATGKI